MVEGFPRLWCHREVSRIWHDLPSDDDADDIEAILANPGVDYLGHQMWEKYDMARHGTTLHCRIWPLHNTVQHGMTSLYMIDTARHGMTSLCMMDTARHDTEDDTMTREQDNGHMHRWRR